MHRYAIISVIVVGLFCMLLVAPAQAHWVWTKDGEPRSAVSFIDRTDQDQIVQKLTELCEGDWKNFDPIAERIFVYPLSKQYHFEVRYQLVPTAIIADEEWCGAYTELRNVEKNDHKAIRDDIDFIISTTMDIVHPESQNANSIQNLANFVAAILKIYYLHDVSPHQVYPIELFRFTVIPKLTTS